MPTERRDFFKLGDAFATVIGDDVRVGEAAPEFTAVGQDWKPVQPIRDSQGKVIILSSVPALDTEVCDRETRRFNEEASKLGEDILIYTVSCDFPMAQKRWCGAAGVERVKVVSDVVNAEFGVKYGALIKDRRYLRRAVFIVNRDGKLTYVNYLPQLGMEPDYDEVIRGGRRRRSSLVAAESGSDAATPAAGGSDAEAGAPVEPLPATTPPSISLAATDSPVDPEAERPADDSPPRGTV